MEEALIYCRNSKKIGNSGEIYCLWSVVNIYRILGAVVNLWEQSQFVVEMEVGAQTWVNFSPQRTSFWIIVNPFGMEEASDSFLSGQVPSTRQEALIEVGLLAFQ